MKKLEKRLFVSAAVLFMASPAFINSNVVSADKVSEAKSAVTSKTTENNALLAKIENQQAQVYKLDAAVSSKTAEVNKKQETIDATESRITEISGEISVTRKELANRKSVLRKQLVELQAQSTDSVTGNVYIDFVLNSDNFTDLISRSLTVNKLNDANKEALKAVKESEDKLASLKSEQVNKKAQLVADKATLVKQQAALSTQKTAATAAQASLAKELEDNKAELATLQGNLTTATAEAKAALVALQAKAAADKAAAAKAAAAKLTHNVINSGSSSNSSSSTNSGTSNSGNGSNSNTSGIGAKIAARAAHYIGVNYVWGGASPSGVDCSGLIYLSAADLGYHMGARDAAGMSTLGSAVSMNNLQVGDLLFWGGYGSATHVAVYIGNNAYIHAPQQGEKVRVDSFSYYRPTTARRL